MSTRVVVCSCMRVFLEVNLQTGNLDAKVFRLWLCYISLSDPESLLSQCLGFLIGRMGKLDHTSGFQISSQQRHLFSRYWWGRALQKADQRGAAVEREGRGSLKPASPAPLTSPATDHTPGPLGSFFPFRHACSFSLPGEKIQMSLRINQAPRFLFLYTVFLFIF